MIENLWATNAVDLLKLLRSVWPDRFVVDIQLTASPPTERWGAAGRNAPVEAVGLSVRLTPADIADVIRLAAISEQSNFEVAAAEPEREHAQPTIVPHRDRVADLTDRELEVLGLMAQGMSNTGIARKLWITGSTVEKHVRNVLRRLDIDDGEESHRRVLAVLTFLDHQRRSS
jgi:DNA-binding NarL/FixJ family response regulator